MTDLNDQLHFVTSREEERVVSCVALLTACEAVVEVLVGRIEIEEHLAHLRIVQFVGCLHLLDRNQP